MHKGGLKTTVATTIVIGLLLATDAFAWYRYTKTSSELQTTQNDMATLQASTTESLKLISDENTRLAEALANEQAKVEDLEDDNRRAERKVDELEKLSELDPELLKKYSRVYFLNENYEPSRLSSISTEYLLNTEKPAQVHSEVRKYLSRLIDGAEDDDIELKVVSAYRSFDTQKTLKDGYVVTYGSGTANQFSAEQGYSEHQLGTAVDFTTPAVGGAYNSFAQTDAYTWLLENAHQYGFILSYPQGNTYYQFEPWHWRFVGVDLARYLHKKNKNFYDMDQRDIDDYLGEIFD